MTLLFESFRLHYKRSISKNDALYFHLFDLLHCAMKSSCILILHGNVIVMHEGSFSILYYIIIMLGVLFA